MVVLLAICAVAAPLNTRAAAPLTVVTPKNLDGWQSANVRSDATVGISSDQPRGDAPSNFGSLKFTTNTITSGQDKADYVKYWGVVPGRTLGNLSALSYEFYRASSSTTPQQFAPAFRLTYQTSGGQTGYLIWENVYNGGSTSTPVPTDQWLAKDMLGGYFWMRAFGPGRTIDKYDVTLAQWASGYTYGTSQPLDANTNIIGIEVGVGSGWGGTFTGYVDDVVASFGSDSISANFDPNPVCTTDCYVDGVNGNDANGGTSAADAKQTIQAAVNQVSAAGTVIVAAGTYVEQVAINKDGLTIQGAGETTTTLQGTSCTGQGIRLSGTHDGLTIKNLSVTGFLDGIYLGLNGETQTNITIEDVTASTNCEHGIFAQAGVYTNMTVNRVTASNNGDSAHTNGRGIWVINGVKTNIAITNSTFNNNKLVGIDFGDGNVTGLTITGNTVTGNGDEGIGVLGAKGPGANLIDGNIVTDNGRYGIEIKVSTGSGGDNGAGSLVISHNTVARTVAATDARDYAGIAVVRRSGNASFNDDQPSGAVVANNDVRGYHRKPSGSTGDGFGIVVEGLNNTIKNNIVTNNDVGIQVQGGNTANVQSTAFFDRGDAAQGDAKVNFNNPLGNTTNVRTVGTTTATALDATHNWWGSNTGPTNAANPSGTGESVTANILFRPWLCDGTDTSAAVGFQPNVTTCGTATKLVFSVQPGNGTKNTPLAQQPTLQALDDGDFLDTAFSGAVMLALGTNPSAGTLGGTVTVNAVGGVATFGGLTVNKAGQGYTLVGSATDLASATSAPFNIKAVATKLVFSTQPGNSMPTTPLAPQPVIAAVDDDGDLDPTFSGAVTLALGANPGTGTLGGTATVNAVNGVATWSGLMVEKVGTGYTLVATTASLASATSQLFDVLSSGNNVATTLIFSTQPGNGTPITPLLQQPVVQVVDNAGQLVTTFNGTVTLALGANPGTGTLGGTVTANAVNGVATWSGLMVDKVGQGYTLVGSGTGLTSATSAPFNINVVATKLVFSTQPGNGTPTTPLAPQPVVQAVDASGNLDTTFSGAITLALGANPSSGILGGTATVNAVNGVALFNGLAVDKAGQGYTLVAATYGLVTATSQPFDVLDQHAGAATKLVFSVQPSNGTPTTPLSRQPVIQVLDSAGQIVTTFNGAVTLALGANPSGGTLGSSVTVNTVNGVATWSGLALDKAGQGYTLVATSTGLSSATSAPFNIVSSHGNTYLPLVLDPKSTLFIIIQP